MHMINDKSRSNDAFCKIFFYRFKKKDNLFKLQQLIFLPLKAKQKSTILQYTIQRLYRVSVPGLLFITRSSHQQSGVRVQRPPSGPRVGVNYAVAGTINHTTCTQTIKLVLISLGLSPFQRSTADGGGQIDRYKYTHDVFCKIESEVFHQLSQLMDCQRW